MFKVKWMGRIGLAVYATEDAAERAIYEILEEAFGYEAASDHRDEYEIVSANSL